MPVDWKFFIQLAQVHGVGPLVSYILSRSGLANRIPETYRKQLNHIYQNNLFRNVTLSSELNKVISVFSDNGIESIVLKGTTLAEQLFDNPALRTVGDMDILVAPDNITRASALLIEMGYQQRISPQEWDHPFHEAPFSKMSAFPLVIELHRNIDDDRLVSFPLETLWQRTIVLTLESSSTRVLSPEDYLIYLSDHFSKHANHLLRSLNDIAELLKKYENSLDWEYIITSARKWEAEIPLYCALKRAGEILEAPVKKSVIRRLRPAWWRRSLLNFLISRDYFLSANGNSKVKDHVFTLARSLMMRSGYQTSVVLGRNYRGKKAVWLRTIIWTLSILSIVLVRNLFKPIV